MTLILPRFAVKWLAISLCICANAATHAAQYPINSTLMCQNAWSPRIPKGELGAVDWGMINTPDRATFTSNTNFWPLVKSANFGLIRVGGAYAQGIGKMATGYNRLDVANANGGAVVELIRSIKTSGAEPLFQIPYNYSADQTKALYDYLNGKELGQQDLGIHYWSIGNEPELSSASGYIPEKYTPEFVAGYIKRISKALKEKDPSAFVQAGDQAWFHADIPKFIGGSADISGRDSNDNWIIDAFSWHRYNLTNLDDDRKNIEAMNRYIKTAAAKHGRPDSQRLRFAYGEFNSHFDNALASPDQYTWTMKTGQLFAEFYGLGMEYQAFAMCPWSLAESGGKRNPTSQDLGIFDLDASGTVFSGRASYHHTAMLGANMRAYFATATDNYNSLKVVAMTDITGTTVMLLNTNQSTGYGYSLNLSSNGKTVSGGAQINVDAGLNVTFNGKLNTFETQTLIFNSAGRLTKRFTYNAANHWAKRSPPTVEIFTGDAVDPSNPGTPTPPAPSSKTYLATSIGISGCTGARDCTANPNYIDLNANTGFRFAVAPGARNYNAYVKVSIGSASTRSMGLLLNNAPIAVLSTDYSSAPRPNGLELGPWPVTLNNGNNNFDVLDNQGTLELDIHSLRLAPR